MRNFFIFLQSMQFASIECNTWHRPVLWNFTSRLTEPRIRTIWWSSSGIRKIRCGWSRRASKMERSIIQASKHVDGWLNYCNTKLSQISVIEKDQAFIIGRKFKISSRNVIRPWYRHDPNGDAVNVNVVILTASPLSGPLYLNSRGFVKSLLKIT